MIDFINLPRNVKESFVRLIVTIIVGTMRDLLHVDEVRIWDIIDEFGRDFHIKEINDMVLEREELLNRRITRDVDEAIREYNKAVGEEPAIPPPIYSEETEGDTLLGGEMRLTAPWYVDPEKD